MNFFKSLLTSDGDISSKRFAGLSLVGLFVVCVIVNAATGGAIEMVEPWVAKGLYGGLGLLGVNVAETIFKK